MLRWLPRAKQRSERFSLFLLLMAGVASAQDPIMRVDVRLVRLVATVKDASGALVGSLDRPDFHCHQRTTQSV